MSPGSSSSAETFAVLSSSLSLCSVRPEGRCASAGLTGKVKLERLQLCKLRLERLHLWKLRLERLQLCTLRLERLHIWKLQLGRLHLCKLRLARLQLCKVRLERLHEGAEMSLHCTTIYPARDFISDSWSS